jgi:hypothetical protein
MTIRRRRRSAKAAQPQAPVVLADVIASSQPPAGSGGEKSSPVITDPVAAPRRRRSNVGGFAMKLSAPSREGEKRRWVNDDGNRLAEMNELGYAFVSETGIQTSDPGSRVTRLVGTKANGEPLHAYLMETPDELYAQGEAEKEAANRQIDEAITAGRDSTGRMDENQYGHGSIKVER